VITSTGGVTKRLFTFSVPVDPGLADWAASYFNERLIGLGLGARMLHQRLHDPSLGRTESVFIDALSLVFTELEDSVQETWYVEGTARLLSPERFADVSELNALMEMLERRVSLLGVLRSALSVIGPLRMDYGRAIRSVREAALQLSSYVADVYDER